MSNVYTSWKGVNPFSVFSGTTYNFLKYMLGNWVSISCNNDGYVTAVNTYLPLNNVFLSTDSGEKWSNITSNIGNVNLSCVSIDSSGKNICLGAIRHGLYISNNSGDKWTETISGSDSSDNTSFGYIKSSSNGEIITVIDTLNNTNHVYLSINKGSTFNSVFESNYNFTGVAMNSDGNIMAICSSNGYLYISNDTGTSWSQSKSADLPLYNWSSITIDSTGDNIAVCSLDGYIYFSIDTGANWTKCTSPSSTTSLQFSSICISSNANVLFVCAINDYIYYSTNNGSKWIQTNTNTKPSNWSALACNNDGSIVYACVNGGNIHIGNK